MSALASLSDELVKLVRGALPAVVGVEHRRGQGSGVVVASDGYVITNAHVVARGVRDLSLRLAGDDTLPAQVVGIDVETDLALLRTNARGLDSLTVADAEPLHVGQLVVAIGNPLRFEGSVSLGVISALERVLPVRRGRPLEGLVQTDAAINPGNSGGPLLDAQGHVVGINTAIIPHAHGIGFAIPARTVAWITSVLLRHGRVQRPRLGIRARGEDVPVRARALVGQPRALRVHDVLAGSPARAAGLEAGDLLLRAGATPLYGIDDLQRSLVFASESDVELELVRAEARTRVSVRAALPNAA